VNLYGRANERWRAYHAPPGIDYAGGYAAYPAWACFRYSQLASSEATTTPPQGDRKGPIHSSSPLPPLQRSVAALHPSRRLGKGGSGVVRSGDPCGRPIRINRRHRSRIPEGEGGWADEQRWHVVAGDGPVLSLFAALRVCQEGRRDASLRSA
jgi:hypothetical protein